MALSGADFKYIRDLVLEATGILLGDDKYEFVVKRVGPIALENGFDDVGDLIDQLQMSPTSKLHAGIIDAVIEDETMFFRDFSSYKFLRHEVGKTLAEQRSTLGKLNIWCAACSSGQEAYSIAIMVKDAMPQFKHWEINILATDISSALIRRAKEGSFSQTEVNRGLPASLLIKHFTREGIIWKIKDQHRKSVKFEVFNLMDTWEDLPIFDIILIRNVLYYFEPRNQRRILKKLRAHMHEDSYLFLSAEERPIEQDFFSLRSEEKDACFQLKSAAERAAEKIEAERSKVEARVETPRVDDGIEDLDSEHHHHEDLIENVEADEDA